MVAAFSNRVVEGKFDCEDLLVVGFDLLSQFHELLVLSLLLGWVVLLAVVGQLIDLQGVVVFLGDLSLALQALDLAGTDLEALLRRAGRRLSCCCLHSSLTLLQTNLIITNPLRSR